MRSEVKWVVAVTEGLVDHSKAFTMSEPEAVEVFGLTGDSFGFWEVSG